METQLQNQNQMATQQQAQPATVTNPNAKIIKRYQNRKLYDTQQSCYVTLEDIAKMIRNNEEVVVIDNKTKKDITSTTLTQIIFEAEKKAKNFISIDTLREIIQTGSGSISSYLEKMLPGHGTTASAAAGNGHGEADLNRLLDTTTQTLADVTRKIDARQAQNIGQVQERVADLQQKLSTIESKIRSYEVNQ